MKDVISLSKDDSAESAASLMVTQRIGCVIIHGEDEKPIGIVTERDLVTKIVANNESSQIKLETIMSSPLIKVNETSSVAVAARQMTSNNIKRLPVTNRNGILRGIITMSDVLRETISDPSISDEDVVEYLTEALRIISKSAVRSP
ncbi:MAG: CBS domain-containing protein [Candidatus Heimdallarchaeota archaeon]